MTDHHDKPADLVAPVVARDREAGRAALDRLGEAVEKVLATAGIDEDELVAELAEDHRLP